MIVFAKKSELNAFIKEQGYGSMRNGNRDIVRTYPEKKIIKGVVLGSTGPLSTTCPQYNRLANLVREFLLKGFTFVHNDSDFAVLEDDKYKISFYIRQFKTYPGQGLDPSYVTHYTNINVETK